MTAPEAPAEPPHPTLGAADGQLVAWAGLGIINAVTIALGARVPPGKMGLRVLHHVYDAGQMLALGLLSSAVVAAYCRLRPAPPASASRRRAFLRGPVLDLAAVAVAAELVAHPLLVDDLTNLAARLSGEDEVASSTLLLPLLIALVALGIPAAAAVGRLLDRPWLRWLGVAIAVAAGIVNQRILIHDYPGAHFYLAWAAAVCGGAAMASLRLPRSAALGSRAAKRAGLALRGAVATFAAYTVVVWPRATVLLSLYEVPGAVGVPFLARLHLGMDRRENAAITPELKAWFSDRSALPAVPPSAPAPAPTNRIVLIILADSLRADVFANPSYAASFPELTALKRQSVYFTQARSPGSQTVYSLTALFASRYFSEMYWTDRQPGGIWAHEDPSVRFPTLLGKAGIPTVTFGTAVWLVNGFGVTEGFSENTLLDPETTRVHSPPAKEVVDATIARLEHQGDGPLFLFIHLLDTHSPYGTGAGKPFQRYIRQIGVVSHEIARVLRTVEQKGLTDRTTVVVASDHGEAFGEHGTTSHSVSLYEELIHIPLMIRTPGAKAREVSTPISLMDIGPTVLDLMGVPTPGTYMGQTLAPLLRGEAPDLTRPIVAEGRLKKAIIFSDKLKVIRDPRKSTIEIYDLEKDPKESKNLFEDLGERGEDRLGVLDAFFAARTLRRPGYVPPYRP